MEVNLEELTFEEQEQLKRNVFLTTLEEIKAWARSSSLVADAVRSGLLRHRDDGTGGSHYDFDRFGVIFRASPGRPT